MTEPALIPTPLPSDKVGDKPAPASEKAVTATPTTPAVQQRSGSPVALLVGVLALGVAGSQPWWGPLVRPAPQVAAAPTADLAPLQAQLEEMSRRLAVTATLEDRLAALEQSRSDAPAEGSDNAAQAEEIAALQDRLNTLSEELQNLRKENGTAVRTATAEKTFMASALQLVAAWQAAQPFNAAWVSAVTSAETLDPQLAALLNDAASTLLPWRDKGIPTLGQLQSRYAAAARSVLAKTAPVGQSWWQQTLGRVEGLVVIRRQAERLSEDDTGNEAALARAEAVLATGDLAGALAVLQSLDETATAAASDWLQGARARVQADQLALRLSTATAELLAPELAHAADDADESEPQP